MVASATTTNKGNTLSRAGFCMVASLGALIVLVKFAVVHRVCADFACECTSRNVGTETVQLKYIWYIEVSSTMTVHVVPFWTSEIAGGFSPDLIG